MLCLSGNKYLGRLELPAKDRTMGMKMWMSLAKTIAKRVVFERKLGLGGRQIQILLRKKKARLRRAAGAPKEKETKKKEAGDQQEADPKQRLQSISPRT